MMTKPSEEHIFSVDIEQFGENCYIEPEAIKQTMIDLSREIERVVVCNELGKKIKRVEVKLYDK